MNVVLFLGVIICGAMWLVQKIFARQGMSAKPGVKKIASFFPLLLFIFVVRSFVFEPFKIPSGSMLPTLWIGDYVFVNKNVYGLKIPVINVRLTQGESPKRGDIAVFRYPPDPSQDFIKRVVAVPGDELVYSHRELSINGVKLEHQWVRKNADKTVEYKESVGGDKSEKVKTYSVLLDMAQSDELKTSFLTNFKGKDNCVYAPDASGFRCKMPENQYFMMGDNRDNSLDSRYWGFVDKDMFVGKASIIWMNWSDWSRVRKIE